MKFWLNLFQSTFEKKEKTGNRESSFKLYGLDLFKKKTNPETVLLTQKDEQTKIVDVQSEIAQLLSENPNITGATFLNLLKSKGFEIVKKDLQPSEADSSTSFPQAVRPTENAKMKFQCILTEADKPKNGLVGPIRFKSIILSEGLGNLVDCFYYTKDCIKSAVPIFEGAKFYADHPRKSEQIDLPERSVRDLIGHYENVRVEEDADGRLHLVGEPVPVKGDAFAWAKELMVHAMEYAKKFPDKDFVGISINADGTASEANIDDYIKDDSIPESIKLKLFEAKEKGITIIRPVSALLSCVSADLVTKAGAGGKVLEILEGEKIMDEKKEIEKKEQSAPQATDSHPDAEQDIALIKKYLDEYLGKESYGEAELDVAKKAHEFLVQKNQKSPEDLAAEAARYVEFAKAMASEEAKKETEETEETEEKKKETEEKKKESNETEEKKKESAEAEKAKEGCDYSSKKESVKESDILLKLKGELAAKEEIIKKYEMKEHLDKILRESKLPRKATDAFRESIGDVRSTKEIDSAFEKFLAGYKASTGSESDLYANLIVSTEKAQGGNKKIISFADCKK